MSFNLHSKPPRSIGARQTLGLIGGGAAQWRVARKSAQACAVCAAEPSVSATTLANPNGRLRAGRDSPVRTSLRQRASVSRWLPLGQIQGKYSSEQFNRWILGAHNDNNNNNNGNNGNCHRPQDQRAAKASLGNFMRQMAAGRALSPIASFDLSLDPKRSALLPCELDRILAAAARRGAAQSA